MNADKLISQATSEVARAAERVKKAEAALEKRIDKPIGKITKLAERAVGHVEEATKLVAFATTTLNRVLPLLEGDVVQRGTAMLAAAAGKLAGSKIGAVQAAAGKLQGAVGGLQQKMAALGGAGAPKAAVAALPSLALKPKTESAAAPAASAASHLLILCGEDGRRYYFGLSSASYDSLRRHSTFGIDSVPRLGRPDAAQAMSQGSETLTLAGTIYLRADPDKAASAGSAMLESDHRELDRLRAIGLALTPLLLTTGYGDVLGRWYMTSLSEEQGAIRLGGLARKQTFTLEFKRYGDDYQNL